MQKKLAAILFSAAVLLFLVCIPIVSFARDTEDTSYYESRDLQAAPEFSLRAAADGSYFTDLEGHLCDYAVLRNSSLRMLTRADLYLFRKPVVNEVVVTDSEMLLPYNEYEIVDEAEIAEAAAEKARRLEMLSELVESYGGTFLYVAVPSKYAYFADRYPWYLNNRSEYISAAASAFFAEMDSRNVHYLDIGAVWEAEGSPAEYYSNGDHHYSWEGCFSAYQAVMEEVNRISGLDLRILSESDLTLSTLPNPYLGSYARKLCAQWDCGELLTCAELAEPIAFTRWDWENENPGASTMIAMPETEWEDVAYSAYMGGDVSETIIKTEREDLPDLLIYGDSFTNAMETILYASFDEMRSIDLRYYDTMPLLEYAAAYQPDVVLCVQDYSQLLSLENNGSVE